MIPRYCRTEISDLWTDEARYDHWLSVELAHLKARERRHRAPEGTADRIATAVTGRLSAARILEIEATSQHDVIAFLTHVEELAGPDARHLHVGLTSSDVLDTALALQLVLAGDVVLGSVDVLLAALSRRALEFEQLPMVGRSHGIHAEPTTFGLALLSHWAEVARGRDAVAIAVRDAAYGTLSGPVGTFAATDPDVEHEALAMLGLRPEPVATQVVPRDRHARYFTALAALASSIERVALSVRHWQRTEVREAEEPFGKGQKGSSAMPHKKNPVLSENVCGLARMVRGHAVAALENVALWHERDISHSSVERVIGPDATALVDFMARRMARVIDGLIVHQDRLAANLLATRGLTMSGHVLLALVNKGMDRQAAYAVVQRCALPAWEAGQDFHALLRADPDVRAHLTEAELAACFDVGTALRHVRAIFVRTLGE